MTVNGKQIPWAATAAVLLGAGVLLAVAALRGAEYDEGYTLLLAAGTPRPAWPSGVFTVGQAREVFSGHASLADIARALRTTDVHPPLYFWTVAVWRWVAGPSLFGVRLLSVLYGVVALALVGGIARRARIPPAGAVLLTIACYGFAYTGAIARDFALAQALSLAAVWLVLRTGSGREAATSPPLAGGGRDADQGWGAGSSRREAAVDCWCRPLPRPLLRFATQAFKQTGNSFGFTSRPGVPTADRRLLGFAAGLCLGAASLSNYLAAFVAGAVLLWLLPRTRLWLAASVGFALFLPADLWFFLAQRGSRPGEFPPFSLIGSLPRLAQYAAANLFGGLPLYAPAFAATAVTIGLAGIAVLLAGLIALRWRRIGTPRSRVLLALAAVAPPAGLLLLGLAFNSTPIELRYLAFATPFVGLLLAGALASLPRRWCLGLGGALLAIQAVSLFGLMTRQETMQPARATAAAAARLADGVGDAGAGTGGDATDRTAGAVVLLPRGNDGVGVVGAFVNEAPDRMRLALADPTDTPRQLEARIAGADRVVLALIGVDAASRATSAMLRASFAANPCWHLDGIGFNVLAFDRICKGGEDVLRRLHADTGSGSGR